MGTYPEGPNPEIRLGMLELSDLVILGPFYWGVGVRELARSCALPATSDPNTYLGGLAGEPPRPPPPLLGRVQWQNHPQSGWLRAVPNAQLPTGTPLRQQLCQRAGAVLG